MRKILCELCGNSWKNDVDWLIGVNMRDGFGHGFQDFRDFFRRKRDDCAVFREREIKGILFRSFFILKYGKSERKICKLWKRQAKNKELSVN